MGICGDAGGRRRFFIFRNHPQIPAGNRRPHQDPDSHRNQDRWCNMYPSFPPPVPLGFPVTHCPNEAGQSQNQSKPRVNQISCNCSQEHQPQRTTRTCRGNNCQALSPDFASFLRDLFIFCHRRRINQLGTGPGAIFAARCMIDHGNYFHVLSAIQNAVQANTSLFGYRSRLRHMLRRYCACPHSMKGLPH